MIDHPDGVTESKLLPGTKNICPDFSLANNEDGRCWVQQATEPAWCRWLPLSKGVRNKNGLASWMILKGLHLGHQVQTGRGQSELCLKSWIIPGRGSGAEWTYTEVGAAQADAHQPPGRADLFTRDTRIQATLLYTCRGLQGRFTGTPQLGVALFFGWPSRQPVYTVTQPFLQRGLRKNQHDRGDAT